ncbi:DUF5343 domain-containing protein [Oscillospiraceae bacterium CM]|nr:DUF5343 domain-containing protein [Oscillospiraceae bacterium CM]
MAEKQYYPMIAETSWWTLREQFKKTVPSVVSISYLKSLLSLTSDQSARNILAPLRQMKIVDENNKPTSRANDWRTDAQYTNVCSSIVDELYPVELKDLFPDKTVDAKKATDWFMHTGQLGDSAAKKVTATFLLLKDGNVKSTDELSKSTKPTKNASDKKVIKPKLSSVKTVQNSGSENNANNNTQDVDKNNNLNSDPLGNTASLVQPSLHIDLQIHISPDASPQQIDSIFSSISKHLYSKN